jgi:hypothetical protein
MGGCCGGTTLENEKGKKCEDDLTAGPLGNRGCTDCICLIIWLVHLVGFVVVVSVGVADGNPTKLYAPRDYQGAYCGVEKQWNNGPDLLNYPTLTYFMNVTHTVDTIAKSVLCGTPVEQYLQDRWKDDPTSLEEYRCHCCKTACSSCTGSYEFVDYSDPSSLATGVSSQIGELTGGSNGLFTSQGLNGDLFANAWNAATAFFVTGCAKSCDSPGAFGANNTNGRDYTYAPAPDDPLRKAWDLLLQAGNGSAGPAMTQAYKPLADVITSQFTFKALPISDCPYHPGLCVPFPGVTGLLLYGGFCQPKMSGSAMDQVGAGASEALQGVADSAVAANATETFGTWMGAIQDTIGAIIISGVIGFVIGFIFLILLRFLISCMVYCSIVLMFVILMFAGGFSYVRSSQCKGASFFESGQAQAQSATASAQLAAAGLQNNNQNPFAAEKMTGKGFDYRGSQTKTKSGKTCQSWDCVPGGNQTTGTGACVNMNYMYNSSAMPYSGLEGNFCRNPTNGTDPNLESFTIWCYTTDLTQRWEVCIPYGVLQPVCANGYEVDGEQARKAMEIVAYVLWALAGLWLVMVWCLFSRIRLAIAANKVAAQFIYHTPLVVFVPIVMAVLGLAWCLIWALLATFLVSQVPADRVPTIGYATYEEAYGYWASDSVWQVGACLGEWPEGFVWKDNFNCDMTNPLCWKCAPPRYIFDARFAYAFFTFLWNNAFMMAILQTVIAGAVGIWFFTPRNDKSSAPKIKTALWNVFRYHSGSLLFGSFIIAVVQFIRYFMMYLEKQAQAQKNKVMVMVLKALQCCMWCLEKCIKFLNKNAYIQIALVGTNFCTSAKKAFGLILRNFIRFGIVASLGWITQLIGVAVITGSTTVLGYFILKAMYPDVNPMMPVILILIIGYVIGRLFAMVFMMAVDTALQCFIICEEQGNASQDFVPGPMVSLLNAKPGGDKEESDNK